ncbi:unnamed protein product [Toxocara canis]|uniref:Ig-like domain-containing protein n=1 Tax=Toxocara canis TaxID=6265 RepID=A0A183VC84_TOXCA|nr:unnamed protein product [Toxocara canis]
MENVTALKGQDVEFRCKVSNLGKHMVFRQRDKYEVRPRVNNDEWVLVVKNVQENDIGGYSCQLNTDPILSRAGYLHLRVKPIVIPQSKVVVAVTSGQATLVCNVEAWPRPTMTWEKNGEEIFDSTKYAIVSELHPVMHFRNP